jgi:hypothetical protein
MKSTIKIGPSFFDKSKKDYAEWRWAWIRELAQNSIDCKGTTEIEFSFTLDPNGNTIAVCQNNGEPMDHNTLVNKFLSLGESGKNFQGTVGGFGKAKELIAFCHESYKIHTGNLLVVGKGADYQLEEITEKCEGTITEVLMQGDQTAALTNALQKFAKHAQWDGKLTFNGERLHTSQHKGTFRKHLPFGRIYTNKSVIGIVCRMHGIPMFIDQYSTQKGIIVELSSDSGERLTSNRDMLQYTYRNQLAEFIKLLNLDERKALKTDDPEITHYPGSKCRLKRFGQTQRESASPSTPQYAAEAVVSTGPQNAVSDDGQTFVRIHGTAALNMVPSLPLTTTTYAAPINIPRNELGIDFYLRNETRLQVPEFYKPEKLSEYAAKLAQIWANVLIVAHELVHKDAPSSFSVGFVFSEDVEALYERRNSEVVYYLNPCKIVQDSTSTRFKKRFLLTEKERIISIAVHELVHGLGFDYHDEEYCIKFTEMMGIILKHRTKFNPCFKV